MGRPRSLACALCCGVAELFSGCGSGSSWELDLTVRVSDAVQADYTGGYPAQVVVVVDHYLPSELEFSGGTAYRIAHLCGASDESAVYRARWFGPGCDDVPRFVRAWIERRESGVDSLCGQLPAPVELSGTRRLPAGAPWADGRPFADGCADGDSQSVSLGLTFRH